MYLLTNALSCAKSLVICDALLNQNWIDSLSYMLQGYGAGSRIKVIKNSYQPQKNKPLDIYRFKDDFSLKNLTGDLISKH